MRLKRYEPLIDSTLKRVATRSLLSSQCNRRRHASTSAASPKNIAVLGAGISGLASAHFVSKEFPSSKITIYESGEESGGWIKSRRIGVPGGDVLFEYGPRTLRPQKSEGVMQLISDLDLNYSVITTPKESPAARNRYVYYPDRLNRMPSSGPEGLELSNLFNLLRSGVLSGIHNAVADTWTPGRSRNLVDESVGAFISRRMDKRLAQNLLSAVFHGIYAGDIWQLSAKTLLSTAWNLEGKYGSIIKGLVMLQSENEGRQVRGLYNASAYDDMMTINKNFGNVDDQVQASIERASTFTFKDGLQQLVQKLQRHVLANEQVDLKLKSPVKSFKMAEGTSNQVEIVAGTSSSQTTKNYDLVISTLRNKDLTDYVTVMTVNLFYKNPKLLPVRGFGYLIPQSVPFEQNPERALGVIFDSDAVQGQDTAEGTKLTVMLGGHWWNDWVGYPDSHEGAELAKSVLERHLGITDEPEACHVNLNKDCIPQYTVGYQDRLRDFAQTMQDQFKGRLRLVGNQFNGVGVNDCVNAAWLLAIRLRGNGWKDQSCGLDHALDERPPVIHYA